MWSFRVARLRTVSVALAILLVGLAGIPGGVKPAQGAARAAPDLFLLPDAFYVIETEDRIAEERLRMETLLHQRRVEARMVEASAGDAGKRLVREYRESVDYVSRYADITPPEYRHLVMRVATHYDLDPRMVASVIQVESEWKPDALGAAGETGLMQILPSTAVWLARVMKWADYDVWDPEQNMLMGAHYLDMLFREYGNWDQALAAYNGGPRGALRGADHPYTRRVLRVYRDQEGLSQPSSNVSGEVNHVKFILALDQGTTSSRAILFNQEGEAVAVAQKEFTQHYPQPGWVEHDAEEIWATQIGTAHEALAKAGVSPKDVAGVGITNQRETTVVWDRETGRPVSPAIVWQCRRTADYCRQLNESGWDKPVRSKTGLVIDAYFSGTKVKWILDQIPGLRHRAEQGEVLFGTIDTWLMWKLSGGTVHATDYSNASRTMLYNIHKLDWDEEILREMSIPRAMLPRVMSSSGIFGTADVNWFGHPIPLAGVAGDQQAALFGQACFQTGMAKNTYGTGCFLLMNTGTTPVESEAGLLTTIAWGLDGRVEYALEGSVFIAGAAIQWLRDELRIIERASDTEALARSISDTGGVYLVPAFVGLGAPYWDAYARGTIVGLTRGSGRAHLARAALESIAYQTRDVLDAMVTESGLDLKALRVDGGAASNDFLLQFQADILATPVERPANLETTALGAAYLAGLATGVWSSKEEVTARWQVARRFEPAMTQDRRRELYKGWQQAVHRSREWAG